MRRVGADELRVAGAVLVALAAGLAALLLALSAPAGGARWSVAAADPEPASAAGEYPADGPIVPTRLAIPAIEVDAVVESRGTVTYDHPFTGQAVEGYDVPESMHTTSWWSDGPRPGSGSMAVILGHQQNAGAAVFNELHGLTEGDEVLLRDGTGAVLRLAVLGAPLTGLDKATSELADALNGHPPDADVVLVTCGGEFDESVGTSTDNTVVFATVVG